MYNAFYSSFFQKPVQHLSVHLATDVKHFLPLEKDFATPHVVLTMEDVILSLRSAMKPSHFVLALLNLAKALSSVFT